MVAVSGLYRYPVKGLSAQPLPHIDITAGMPFAFDRVYALARPGVPIDTADPQWAKKGLFVMLMLDEALATVATELDIATLDMTVNRNGECLARANVADAKGRTALEHLIWKLLPALPAPPTLLASRGGHFMDKPDNVISLINLATVRSLEQRWGYAIDPLRFRANIYIVGVAPWQEFDWIGSDIAIGGVTFTVDRRNGRCGATNVDPKTGARDLNIPQALRANFGHKDLGVYLIARNAGSLAVGDALTLPRSMAAAPAAANTSSVAPQSYMCRGCFYIYEQGKGLPQQSVKPGTSFADLPPNWRCPDCGTEKTNFRSYATNGAAS